MFAGTNVEITQDAQVLGSVSGNSEASNNFVKDAYYNYTKSLERFGQFALTSPQNAYACLTKRVQQKLSFVSRITPSNDGVLDQVEEQLHRLIPKVVGKEKTQEERELFSLLLSMSGLQIALPQHLKKNFEQSIELSSPLTSFNNDSFEIQQCELVQSRISLRQKADMQSELISKKSRIETNLPELKFTIQLASEKGASSWLNALLLSKHGFELTKTEFCYGALRYTWGNEEHNPHAKSCPKTIKYAYKYHERIKRNNYEERIRETEHSSFNALVFACSGGAGPSASRVMKQLKTKISKKRGEPYADT